MTKYTSVEIFSKHYHALISKDDFLQGLISISFLTREIDICSGVEQAICHLADIFEPLNFSSHNEQDCHNIYDLYRYFEID